MSRDELIADLADLAELHGIMPPGSISTLDVEIKVVNRKTGRYAWLAVNMPNNDSRFREVIHIRDHLAIELLRRNDER